MVTPEPAGHAAEQNQNHSKPLSNLRVLDLTRALAGPYCGQLLADMGAEVIKVESPDGDMTRSAGPRAPYGETITFTNANRGKRSIVLNLKTPEGRRLLMQLAGKSDVLIHNYLPATAAELGIDVEALHDLNPRLVVGSLTAYGARGKMRDWPGFEPMVSAFAGVTATTTLPGQPPVRSPLMFLDLGSGFLFYGAVVTALLARAGGATRQHVQLSLLETAVTFLGYYGANWLATGALPEGATTTSTIFCPFRAFKCKDGDILVGVVSEAHWQAFCGALGRAELAQDERFNTNLNRLRHKPALDTLLEPIFVTETVEAWLKKLAPGDIPAASVNTLDRTLTHPQTLLNDLIVTMQRPGGAPVQGIGLPFKLSSHAKPSTIPPPHLGEHTEEVLKSIAGLSEDELTSLRRQGIISKQPGV